MEPDRQISGSAGAPSLTQNKSTTAVPAANRFKLPPVLSTALFLFLLAGSLIAAILPNIMPVTGDTPTFIVFLGAGLLMIFITAALFNYLNRLNLGFGKSALVLALGYNCAIVVIKFILAPQALYLANKSSGPFDATVVDVNSGFYYLSTGVIVMLLYLIVFRLIYGRYLRKLLARPEMANYLTPPSSHHKHNRVIWIVAAIAAVVLTGGGLLFLPLILGVSVQLYLGYIFGAMAVPLLLAIALAIYLARRSFEIVEAQAVATRNASLMASFFWLGCSLIILYHVMWVVFMITLVNIWPFKTVTSK